MLSFNFQFLFAGFTNPVMFSIDEGVVVDAFSVIFGADVTLHIINVGPTGLLSVLSH